MRTARRKKGRRRRPPEEVMDLLRLGGLAMDLDGFMWIRVALSSIRARLPGRLGVLTLVLAAALRFLPLVGAGVCSAERDRSVRALRPPAVQLQVEPLRPPVDLTGPVGTGVAAARGDDASPPVPRHGRSGKVFGATRWPEAIVPKEVRLPRPG